MLAGGDWMREYIDNAALQEDLDALIRFQKQSIEGDQSLVRHEKARAKMWSCAIRGLWPKAIEEAKKVLAQSGGDDDEARMLIATGYIATRRLDAAEVHYVACNNLKDTMSLNFSHSSVNGLIHGTVALMRMTCGIGRTTRPSIT